MVPDKLERVGRYRIERSLGSGAMGHVYLARDEELDRDVAVKTVRFGNLPEAEIATFLERFRNEARAAAKLAHPNVVQVYDVGEAEGVGPYLVFEYVKGASLKEQLRARGPLAPDAVVRLAEEVESALRAAHARGIVHRDIKPENLLLTEEGRTKLADFGVARLPNAELTREGQFLGTPCYAAPETLKAGTYGPATDTFSLASVLYEAATGKRAFPGEEAVAVAHAVIYDEIAAPSSVAPVPRELDAVFQRALAKEPSERFASGEAMVDALRAAYESAGLLVPASREPTVRVNTGVPDDEPESPLARVAMVVGLVAMGFALILAFERPSELEVATDASVAAPLRDDPPRALRPAPRSRRRRDAAVQRPDGGTSEAPAIVDAGSP